MDTEDFPNWGDQLGNQAVGDTMRVPKDTDRWGKVEHGKESVKTGSIWKWMWD
jgi:hypothetical protein